MSEFACLKVHSQPRAALLYINLLHLTLSTLLYLCTVAIETVVKTSTCCPYTIKHVPARSDFGPLYTTLKLNKCIVDSSFGLPTAVNESLSNLFSGFLKF